MENVDTIENLNNSELTTSNIMNASAAFIECQKLHTYLKKNKEIKHCLIPKPVLSTFAYHSFRQEINLYILLNTSNTSYHNTNIKFYLNFNVFKLQNEVHNVNE